MRPPCWWWLAQMPAYNTSRPPSLLALPCVAAWLACWCRWRFVPCWAVCVAFRALSVCWWYNYTSRARCAQYTPVSVPCVNPYKSTSRASNWRRPCFGCLAVCPSLRCVCVACWPRAPFQQTAAGFYPARLALPAPVNKRPVLPIFRRFGGLSALRWCPVLARCPCARFAGVGVLLR